MDSEHSHFSHKKTHPRQLGISIDRWGRNLVACCPFHAPEESSLFFYDALGYWRYRCLQCGNEGDLMEFVIRSRFNGLDEESAKLEAAEFFGSNKDAAEDKELLNWKQLGGEKVKILEAFVSYCYWAAAKSATTAEFLEARGWTVGQAQLYGIGYYSGDPEPFYSYCLLQGIERHQVTFYLDNLELSREPRLTIPARNAKGVIHSVYGRTLDDAPNPYMSFASGPATIPFNIQSDIERPIIVEGFFDALTADLAGIPGVCSILYQELAESHLYKLKACGAESVTLLLRREENRRAQEYRVQRYLKMAEGLGLRMKSIVLPRNETVDKIVRKNGADQLLELIRRTEEDTVHTHRRSMLLQDIKENFDTAMNCPSNESVGYALHSFPKLTEMLDGIQSGCYFVSSQPYAYKSLLLSSFALDFLENNSSMKLIYIALETPRRQVFDRFVSMKAGLSILETRKQNESDEVNQAILNATKDLISDVKNNRLEIWEDDPTFDNQELLSILKDEQKNNSNLLVIVDGIDHLKISDHMDITDIHERRSSAMLDLYKALDIPIFLGGDLIEKDGSLAGPRAYLRDSDAIYWLEAKGGNLFLTVNSKRLGKNHVFEGSLIIDPNSSRMKEE
jgi:hypothetical protein